MPRLGIATSCGRLVTGIRRGTRYTWRVFAGCGRVAETPLLAGLGVREVAGWGRGSEEWPNVFSLAVIEDGLDRPVVDTDGTGRGVTEREAVALVNMGAGAFDTTVDAAMEYTEEGGRGLASFVATSVLVPAGVKKELVGGETGAGSAVLIARARPDELRPKIAAICAVGSWVTMYGLVRSLFSDTFAVPLASPLPMLTS